MCISFPVIAKLSLLPVLIYLLIFLIWLLWFLNVSLKFIGWKTAVSCVLL